ncbi:hypothetical protein [Vagococcus jeotgali]|uniref:hypothetical protein n=1 Tax=Vagococcus jeotgali TaxID=3109030 RepID=UPI002DD89503|nr:hypothetical protein [Vagococcus sp. B2T-5]
MFRLSKKTLNNLLIAYWVIVPLSFYLYIVMTTFKYNISLSDLLRSTPLLNVAVLISSLLIIQLAVFLYVKSISSSKNGLLGHFLWFVMAQQILTGNIIGAGIVFFYERQLPYLEEKQTLGEKILVVSSCIFISLISLLIIFITFRTKGRS